jgi:hypothetical protein
MVYGLYNVLAVLLYVPLIAYVPYIINVGGDLYTWIYSVP